MASNRLIDVHREIDLSNFIPVIGIFDAPDMNLPDSLRFIASHTTPSILSSAEIDAISYAAHKNAKRVKRDGRDQGLNIQESAASNAFTQETPLYKEMNNAFRSRDRSLITPYFPYLKLLLSGLSKLTPVSGDVVRGVKKKLSHLYKEGDEGIWWPASSATNTLSVLSNPQFLGKSRERTIFQITCRRAVDISAFSTIEVEDERLILPGFSFVVKSLLDAGNGLTMIQLVEDMDAPPLIPGLLFRAQKVQFKCSRITTLSFEIFLMTCVPIQLLHRWVVQIPLYV
jgi:hypothetical protein